MKPLLLPLALLALAGCSKKDEARTSCCRDNDYKVVSAHPNLTLSAPNAITPNGDGLNDRFYLLASDAASPNVQAAFAVRTLTVYRLGVGSSPVYHSSSYQQDFDGHDNNGRELAEGTYRYEAMLDDNSITGDLCIIRQRKACPCRTLDANDPALCD